MTPAWQVPEFNTLEFRPKSSEYGVLIPVLNEGDRIKTQLVRMKNLNLQWDCIIVDGGSTDGALDEKFLRENNLKALLTKTGPGALSAQMRVGLAYMMNQGYKGVILIDGNNKDNPGAIPQFVEKLKAGYDHVQGSRFVEGGVAINNPISRTLAIQLIHAPLISMAGGFRYTDTTNGYRAYSSRFLLDAQVQPFRNVFNRYELHYYLAIQAARLKFEVCEIPVERIYPKGKVPTKIKSFSGHLEILKTLALSVGGHFDPKENS